MASTTGPNLEPGRIAVERLMDDACVIRRASGTRTLNEITGKLESDPPTVIYDDSSVGAGGRSLADEDQTGGMCTVSVPQSQVVDVRTDGGRLVVDDRSVAKIPVDAPLVLEGDLLTVVSSRRDPQLVGNEYRVARVVESTYAISRRMILETP